MKKSKSKKPEDTVTKSRKNIFSKKRAAKVKDFMLLSIIKEIL